MEAAESMLQPIPRAEARDTERVTTTAGVGARLKTLYGRAVRVRAWINAQWRLRAATRIGYRVTVYGGPRVVNEGTLIIGNRARIYSTVATTELVTLPGGCIEIGDNVFINYGSSLSSTARVTVGNDCLIGAHVQVMDCDYHRVEDKSWDTTGEPIVIEDRAWLGNRSIILKGVRVGHDAVVAAGSVVTRDVPPRTVVAGVPAKVIRHF